MSGETVDVCLHNIHGETLSYLAIKKAIPCAHVAAYVSAIKKGCITRLMAGQTYLNLDCSLERQGVTKDADITCVFSKVTSAQYAKVVDAWEQGMH